MRDDSRLYELLLKVAAKTNTREINEGYKDEVWDIIEGNELEDDEKVPAWVFLFWEAIEQGNTIERESIYFGKQYGDVVNFMAETEDVIDMDMDEQGNWYTMTFSSLGLAGTVFTENSTMFVKKIEE